MVDTSQLAAQLVQFSVDVVKVDSSRATHTHCIRQRTCSSSILRTRITQWWLTHTHCIRQRTCSSSILRTRITQWWLTVGHVLSDEIMQQCRWVVLHTYIHMYTYIHTVTDTVTSQQAVHPHHLDQCRMTNYELLRWLVETPSRDVEHYRMLNVSAVDQ